MKKILFIIIVSFACLSNKGCFHHEPEFVIDGVGYYTDKRCFRDTNYSEYCWHYGYNVLTGIFEYHYGIDHKHECLEYIVDTIKIDE